MSLVEIVCPQQCQAKILPMDMETIEDCQCYGHDNKTAILHYNSHRSEAVDVQERLNYRCPENASTSRLHPLSFADCICHDGYTRDNMSKRCLSNAFSCSGRYKNKAHIKKAKSIADCDCQTPYNIDDRSGECQLLECPRAGHYMRKNDTASVQSLADCTCIDPYVKVEETGECIRQNSFECPKFSVPVRLSQPHSFKDCRCTHGFIRDSSRGMCKHERHTYICPPLSSPKHHLPIGQQPRGFHDCVCHDETNIRRNEKYGFCERFENGTNYVHGGHDISFQCPPFSRTLSPSPVSVEQCECFPGYVWKFPEMVCDRSSKYHCPAHSYFSNNDKIAEETIGDCHCAHGYYRDEHVQECKSWYLAANGGCPANSFLRNWPLHGNDNCECVYGKNTSASVPAPTTNETGKGHSSVVCNDPVSRSSVRSSTSEEKQDYLQCPPHSLANNWPVTKLKDCSCLPGYTMHHILGAECEANLHQSHANETKTCDSPLVLQERTGHCRLPLEKINQTNVTEGFVVHHGVEYQYVLSDHNVMVVQGDIAIGTLFKWNDISIPLFHGYYDDERDHRWREAIICFEIAQTVQEPMLHSAMKHIHDLTKFVFHHCQDNSCHRDHTCGHDYIQIVPAKSSCYSYIGRVGGRQLMGISSECGTGNIMHVLLHAIGLHHTIDRFDRNDHVRIAWECIPVQQRNFFQIKSKISHRSFGNEWEHTPYDFSSIMHPPSDAFVPKPNQREQKDADAIPTWCQSIYPLIADTSKREQVMAAMGQRDRLSEGDVHAVRNLYPELREHPHRASHVAHNGTTLGRYSVYSQLIPSRLHRRDDVITHEIRNHAHRNYLYGNPDPKLLYRHQFATSFGIMLTAFGIILFGSYAIVEWRRRRYDGWRKHFGDNDSKNLFENRVAMSHYGESLLSDRVIFD